MTTRSTKPTQEQIELFKNYIKRYQNYRDYLIKNRKFNTWDQKIEYTSQLFSNLIEMYDIIVRKYYWETAEKLFNSKLATELSDRFSLCYNSLVLIKETNQQAKNFYEFLCNN